MFEMSTRFCVAVVGRQFGKSTIGLLRDFKNLLTIKSANHYTIYPTFRQAKVQYRRFFHYFGKYLSTASRSELSAITFNGGRIQFFGAGDWENIKGDTLTSARIDEAALCPANLWIEAIRPMLATTNGRCDFYGTPKGKNWFFELAALAQSGDADWNYFHAASKDSPFFPESEYEHAKKTTPQIIFEQEYNAAFIESGGEVFKNFRDCIKGAFEPPRQNAKYVIGVDLARTIDFTVISVWDEERKHLVYFDRFNQIDWSLQEAKIVATALKYNNALVVVDATGVGDPVFERLRQKNLNVKPYKITSQNKQKLIESLLFAVEKVEITFPHHADIVQEFSVFAAEQMGNYVRYSAPSGYHDDIILSFALAVEYMTNRPRGVVYREL